MSLVGLSKYFIYNFNIMFIFSVIAFILFLVFYIKYKKSVANQKISNEDNQTNAYQFFSFDTLLYMALWFGSWILFTG